MECITGPITRMISRVGMIGVYEQFSPEDKKIFEQAGVVWPAQCALALPLPLPVSVHVQAPCDAVCYTAGTEKSRDACSDNPFRLAGLLRLFWARHGHLL